jgi:hypothetical protein
MQKAYLEKGHSVLLVFRTTFPVSWEYPLQVKSIKVIFSVRKTNMLTQLI